MYILVESCVDVLMSLDMAPTSDCCLVTGGNVVPLSLFHEQSRSYNISNEDLANLHSDLSASIRKTLYNDIRQQVEKQVNEVDWILVTHEICTCTCTYIYIYMYMCA